MCPADHARRRKGVSGTACPDRGGWPCFAQNTDTERLCMAGEGIIGSWRRLNLVGRIAIGLAAAVCVALLTRWLGGGTEGWEATVARTGYVPEGWPAWVLSTGELLGDLFVGALKAVAPVLVFALVMAAIAQHQRGTETNIRPVLVLYLLGTFAAAWWR